MLTQNQTAIRASCTGGLRYVVLSALMLWAGAPEAIDYRDVLFPQPIKSAPPTAAQPGTHQRGIAGRKPSRQSPAKTKQATALTRADTSSGQYRRISKPGDRDHVIGQDVLETALRTSTLLDIGRHYGVGYEEISLANQKLDMWMTGAGKQVIVPVRTILPDTPRKGIVINLSERRLYYFPRTAPNSPAAIKSFAVTVGDPSTPTPLGEGRVLRRLLTPTWYPTRALRQYLKRRGDELPNSVGPGPDNPLGAYALELSIPLGGPDRMMIHSTNKPWGIGMAVDLEGRLPMFPEGMEQLFEMASVGTPVRIVDQPVKMAWHGNELLLEIHPGERLNRSSLADLAEKLYQDNTKGLAVARDSKVMQSELANPTGVVRTIAKLQ